VHGGAGIRGLGGSLGEQGDRCVVARAREPRDVMRARRRARAAPLERAGHPLVGAQPPRRWRRVVDGAAHERVAERECPAVAGRVHEVGRHELVDGVLLERGPGRRRGQLRVERVAGDGRALDECARHGGERGELDLDGAEHRARDRRRRAAGGARQLGQVQQVAAGVARHPFAVASVRHRGQQLERLGVAQRFELQLLEPSQAPRRAEHPQRRAAAPARRDRQQVRAGRRTLYEMVDELE
jgi:hypothetical protein